MNRMVFGKSVGAEPFKAGECLFGELGRIAVADHAGDQLVLEFETPPVNPAQTIATRIALS
jgi:hypothetical protein